MDKKYKIGNFFAQLRKEKNMTQEELASKLGVSAKAVSKWENAKCLPEVAQLQKMSKIYDVSIDELLFGERVSDSKSLHEQNLSEVINRYEESIKSQKMLLILLLVSLFAGTFLNSEPAVIYAVIMSAAAFLFINILVAKNAVKNDNTTIAKSKYNKHYLKTSLKIVSIISCILSLIFIIAIVVSLCIGTTDGFIALDLTPPILNYIFAFIYLIYLLTLVASVGYVFNILVLKDHPFKLAKFVKSISFLSFLVAIAIAPVFAIFYYIDTIKILKSQD